MSFQAHWENLKAPHPFTAADKEFARLFYYDGVRDTLSAQLAHVQDSIALLPSITPKG